MLPQAAPILVALTITTAIGFWNDYMTPFMYFESYPTVALGLFQFQKLQIYRSNMPVFFSAVVMSAIPVFVLFVIFHKTIMENMVAGGLKG
jgi:ABC-type glycerol-3-phosphate transport system permease component